MNGTSSTIKRRTARIAAVCTLATGGLVATAFDNASALTDVAITICRATNSQSQPYVLESVSPINLIATPGSPLAMTVGPLWTDSAPFWGDIVPPIAGSLPDGQNWSSGAAILNNNCIIPQSQAAPVTSVPVVSSTTQPAGDTTTTVAYDSGGVEVQGPVVNPVPHVLPSTGASSTGSLAMAVALLSIGSALLYGARRPRHSRRRS